MADDREWISQLVEAAQAAHPGIHDLTATLTKDLLVSQLGDHLLTPRELSEATEGLLAIMSHSASSDEEADHED